MRFFYRFNEVSNKVLESVLLVTLSCMVFLIFSQVIFRYVLKQSLSWSEELARYLFVWLTFLGASIATRRRAHIKVSILVDGVKSKHASKVLKILANCLSITFLFILLTRGLTVAVELIRLGQISPSMGFLPIGVVYLAIPVGSFFMILNLIEIIIKLIKSELN